MPKQPTRTTPTPDELVQQRKEIEEVLGTTPEKVMYVVVCDQSYANHYRVVGVYDTKAQAEEVEAQFSDYVIEEFVLNRNEG